MMATTNEHKGHKRRAMTRLLGGVALVLALVSCERPFVPPTPPEISVIQPNLSSLFSESETVLRVRSTSFRDVVRVEVDGVPMQFDDASGHWVDTLSLDSGTNTFLISAFDVEGIEGQQEIVLTRLQFIFDRTDAPSLPGPWRVGGHTATMLNDGSLLIAGGAISATSPAIDRAFILPPGGTEFQPTAGNMLAARTGHSASLLEDGRVLIVGGATRERIFNSDDFVTAVEVYDPSTGRFDEYPFSGNRIARSLHSTIITRTSTGTFVDVFGGLGRFDDSESQDVVIRRDIRTLRIRNDSLVAFPFDQTTISGIDGSYGHAVAVLNTPSAVEVGRFIVTGTTFLNNGLPNSRVHFRLDYNQTPIRVGDIAMHITPRQRHAAVALQDGIALFFGGFNETTTNVVQTSEVYISSNDRFFEFANTFPSIPRFGHTATKFPDNRILIVGGFLTTGVATSATEWFDAGL